ncbi:hypothetical protein ACWIG4_30205 [Streptomyces sp. NPDC002248]
MTKYRKKPIEIEAQRLTPETLKAIKQWVGTSARVHTEGVPLGAPIKLAITTPGGVMLADFGDWIIKGVAGEFYPRKPDIFAATYEKVDSDEPPQDEAVKMTIRLTSLLDRWTALDGPRPGITTYEWWNARLTELHKTITGEEEVS